MLFAAYMPTSGLLQGAGDAIWASVTSLATLSARVAVSYLLAYAFSVGYASCWLSLPVGWALGIAITYPRYFGKKWMSKRVVREPVEAFDAKARRVHAGMEFVGVKRLGFALPAAFDDIDSKPHYWPPASAVATVTTSLTYR